MNAVAGYSVGKPQPDRELFFRAIEGFGDEQILRSEELTPNVILGLKRFGEGKCAEKLERRNAEQHRGKKAWLLVFGNKLLASSTAQSMSRSATRVLVCGVLGWIVLSLGAGCAIPLGRRTSTGHAYTSEELAFLADRTVSREEVITTLGAPLWESSEQRVMFYEWETSFKWYVVPPKIVGSPGKKNSKTQREGLFIAYLPDGTVSAHEICRVGSEPPESLGAEWISRHELAPSTQ